MAGVWVTRRAGSTSAISVPSRDTSSAQENPLFGLPNSICIHTFYIFGYSGRGWTDIVLFCYSIFS